MNNNKITKLLRLFSNAMKEKYNLYNEDDYIINKHYTEGCSLVVTIFNYDLEGNYDFRMTFEEEDNEINLVSLEEVL